MTEVGKTPLAVLVDKSHLVVQHPPLLAQGHPAPRRNCLELHTHGGRSRFQVLRVLKTLTSGTSLSNMPGGRPVRVYQLLPGAT